MILLASLVIGAIAPDIVITSPEGRMLPLLARQGRFALCVTGLDARGDANLLAQLSLLSAEQTPTDVLALFPSGTPNVFTASTESIARIAEGYGKRAILINPSGRVVKVWNEVQPQKVAERISMGEPPAGYSLSEVQKLLLPEDSKQTPVLALFLSSRGVVDSLYWERINAIHQKCMQAKIELVGLLPNAGESDSSLRSLAAAAEFKFRIMLDPGAALADACVVRRTPTSLLLDANGSVFFFGGIDGNTRVRPDTRAYLAEAIDAMAAGKKPAITSAFVFGTPIKRSGD